MSVDIKKILGEIRTNVQTLEVRFEQVKEKQSVLDKMIVQLEHEIELYTLDAVGMAKKMKEFKGVLKLRRIYKNEMALLLEAKKVYSLKNANNAVNTLVKGIAKQDSARFKDRVTTEIREEIRDEIEAMK